MSGETMTVGGISVPITADMSGLDKSLGGLDKKTGDAGKKAAASFAGKFNTEFLALSAVATAAVAGIVFAIKRVTDGMASVGEQAQAIGLTTEALSRLQFAARVTGASVEHLNTAVVALSRRMGERDELSEGARLFAALGVSVHDASGQVKGADRVLAEVADKFSRMKDGAQKTEIAVRLFGDSGARLIPLLNRGSAGMADLSAQSDHLGNTLDSKSVTSATEFSHSIDRLVASLEGWARSVISGVLPALTYLVNDMTTQSRVVGETDKKWSAFDTTLRILISTGEAIRATFSAVGSVIGGVVGALINLAKRDFSAAGKSLVDGMGEAVEAMNQGSRNLAVVWTGWETTVESAAKALDKKGKVPIVKSSEEISKALAAIKLANQYAFQDLLASDTTPYMVKMKELEDRVKQGTITFREFQTAVREMRAESGAAALQEIMSVDTKPFADRITELNALVENGSIKWRDYQSSVRSVADAQAGAMNDLASTTAQALTTIFEDNKAAATAAAIINTLQGITKALATYPPPYSFAMAGLQAAMGFAQVAKINSTTQKSTSAGAAPSTGGATATAAGVAAGGSGGPQRTLMVEGLNPSQMFSGATMRDFARQVLEYQRDGGKVVLV